MRYNRRPKLQALWQERDNGAYSIRMSSTAESGMIQMAWVSWYVGGGEKEKKETITRPEARTNTVCETGLSNSWHKSTKRKSVLNRGHGWELTVDLDRMLVLLNIVETNLRTDAVLMSQQSETLVAIELTVPCSGLATTLDPTTRGCHDLWSKHPMKVGGHLKTHHFHLYITFR